MTIAPSPANPELLEVVKDLIYDEVFNDFNPPEQSTQLEGAKNHPAFRGRQYLLDGLTFRDFQVLVDKRPDEESAALLHAYGRIQELRAAAHPKKLGATDA